MGLTCCTKHSVIFEYFFINLITFYVSLLQKHLFYVFHLVGLLVCCIETSEFGTIPGVNIYVVCLTLRIIFKSTWSRLMPRSFFPVLSSVNYYNFSLHLSPQSILVGFCAWPKIRTKFHYCMWMPVSPLFVEEILPSLLCITAIFFKN